MLISEEYRKINAKLHKHHEKYGTSGLAHINVVAKIADSIDADRILDYGCGKGMLSDFVPTVINYDPAIPEFNIKPYPVDMVVCTDVLEHVEPECIEQVLDHLQELTRKVLYLIIALVPAKKILADGRNAHILQKPLEWWKPKIERRFDILREDTSIPQAIIFECAKKEQKPTKLIGLT